MTPIRVVVVDDEALIRSGINAIFERGSEVQIVGEAADGESAVRVVRRLLPDVVLMDLMMPAMTGVQARRQIVAAGLAARVLVLTALVSDDDVLPAIQAGSSGYLLKDSEPRELMRAIRQVHRGQPVLHSTLVRNVLRELNRPAVSTAASRLTSREVDVLRLVAQGLSNHEIAEALVLGETTVRTHVSSILDKLQLESRTQAALYALRTGLASPSDARLYSQQRAAVAN
jgi:two-component system, NarL family, response regulator LiaR